MEQFSSVADIADWVIVGAPAPLGLVAPRDLGDKMVYLGRERLGTYGLFVYATSLFPVRQLITQRLRTIPVAPDPHEVEEKLTDLALQSANGVLRIGRTEGSTMWEQVGVIMANSLSRRLDV